jgi:hypothetical protein
MSKSYKFEDKFKQKRFIYYRIKYVEIEKHYYEEVKNTNKKYERLRKRNH